MNNNLEIIISSASLLLTTITLFFTVWYPSISESINLNTNRIYEDMKKDHEELKTILFSKALPLAVFTTITTIIYLPYSFSELKENLMNVYNCYLISLYNCDYDTVISAFLLIEFCLIFLSSYFWYLFIKVKNKNKIMKQKKG